LHGTQNPMVSPNIFKFAELTEIVIDCVGSSLLNSSWGFSYLPNNFRTFIFKLHSNTLGINSRVAHFVRGHPNTCTFCDITHEPDENSESILHLFFNCTHVEPVLSSFYGWLLNLDNRYMPTRSEFFYNFATGCLKKNKIMLLVNLIVKKYIWDCKLRFSLPSINNLKQNFISEINYIIRQSSTVRVSMQHCAIFDHIHEIRF